MADPNYDVLIALLNESKESHKESKEDLRHLRDTTNAIRDDMGNISGQIQLLSQATKSDKAESDKSFQRIHGRVDAEAENIKELAKAVNDIAPQVNRITTVFDWALKAIVTALVGGVMYAVSLMIAK